MSFVQKISHKGHRSFTKMSAKRQQNRSQKMSAKRQQNRSTPRIQAAFGSNDLRNWTIFSHFLSDNNFLTKSDDWVLSSLFKSPKLAPFKN